MASTGASVKLSPLFQLKMLIKTMILLLFLLTCSQKEADAVNRPRGVALSKMSFYNGDSFTCLDGSKTIEMELVNDDYCDCEDGTDEPGTSACSNGVFNCKNAGFQSLDIPSSRVNDGICDCCDGSDEYSGLTLCEDNCNELGQALREAEEKKRLLLNEGYKIYDDYCKQGQTAKEESRVKLETLEKDRFDLETKLEEAKKAKEAAEGPEKEAKDKHMAAWQEEKDKRAAELDQIKCTSAFQELDKNNDNFVSIDEIKAHLEFDISGDREVSDEEAKEYLEENDQVDLQTFEEKIWKAIKQIYKKPGSDTDQEVTPPPPPPTPSPLPKKPVVQEEDDDEDYEQEEVGDIPKTTEPENEEEKSETNPEDVMPEYNEETKSLIEAADKARTAHSEIDTKFHEVKNELEGIQKMLELDFGSKNEFYPLKDQCFEYTDREYIYKFCPYDRTSQRPKHGGAETSLGLWHDWAGEENDRYKKQKYTNGQNCWNGPDRSVVVTFHCGLVNEVTSASEPSRCEYAFDFNTPAACNELPQPVKKNAQHDEL